MKLAQFLETVFLPRKIRANAKNTMRLYRYTVRHFEFVIGRPAQLEDLCDANVQLTMRSMLERGCSPYTANKERSQLCAIWRFACREGRLKLWPNVNAELEPERVPRAWMEPEIRKLYSHVDALEGNMRGLEIPQRLWWRALLMVAFDTAERIGAVSGAEWDNLDGTWLLFPAEVRKGKRRDRLFELDMQTVEVLIRLRKLQCSHMMFPWPYSPSYIWTKYDAILRSAGLPHGPRDKFHRIRKTVASIAHACGLNAQELLDHQDRRTTQKYLDPRFTRNAQACTVVANYLADPSICHRNLNQRPSSD